MQGDKIISNQLVFPRQRNAIVWRNGIQSLGAQSLGPSQGHCLILKAVNRFGETAISQIAHEFGKVRACGSLKRRLLALLEDGFVEYTIPDKPNSRLQKYRLTSKGRAMLTKNDKAADSNVKR